MRAQCSHKALSLFSSLSWHRGFEKGIRHIDENLSLQAGKVERALNST